MMELNIGARLAELRRNKGLTQEQLADRLGVSAPAVSKWETGHSYPDITLLCPLARALGVNVDTLLRFEQELPNGEVMGRVNAILETARLEGWEEGERQLDGLLRQYPNSDALKYNAALAQNAYMLFDPGAGQELREKWAARKRELLEEVRASGTGAYWEAATFQLAQAAASEHRLDEAERLLKELPEQGVDPTVVRVQIAMMKGSPEEALKVAQKRLYNVVWQVQSCLGTMLIPGVVPDPEQALELCRAHQVMDELFGLGGLYDGLFLQVYAAAGRWEEAADRLERYVDAMLGTHTVPRAGLFSPGVEAEEKPGSSREIRMYLVKELEEEALFQPVLQYEKARAALERLKAADG